MAVLCTPVLSEAPRPGCGQVHLHDKICGSLAAIAAETIRQHQPDPDLPGICHCGEAWPCPQVCLAYHELTW
jgi:hypothetical protein